jgi:hypothetical protein
VARRRKNEAAAGWNPRLAGVVLCTFFILGMMTGFSATGRALVIRVSSFLSSLDKHFEAASGPAHGAALALGTAFDRLGLRLGLRAPHPVPHAHCGAPRTVGSVAIVERRDGFYALSVDGELNGPVSPNSEGDLPILSGSRLENVRGVEMVEYAALLVRAEADLSKLISEMKVGDDGTASLYLERSRTEVMFDLDRAALEMPRANEVLRKWRGREQMIAAIDMTTPGEAVVRLRGVDSAALERADAVRRIARRTPADAPGTEPMRRSR